MMKKLFMTGLIMFLVFFAIGTIVWFTVEDKNNQIETIEKSFKPNEIKRINIHSDNADVRIKKGDTFHVSYEGKSKVNISNQNKTLQVSDNQNVKKRMLNVNPFNGSKAQLTVTVPSKQLDEINVTTQVGVLDVENIQSSNATFWNEVTGQINVNNCTFKDTNISANETFISVNNSALSNSEISVNKGKIAINDALVKKSVFKVNRGSMELNKMQPECDLKASVNHGDISMRYLKSPKDVMLKLVPENGKIHVNVPNLHQGKNGKGQHLIELYTNQGDINIQ